MKNLLRTYAYVYVPGLKLHEIWGLPEDPGGQRHSAAWLNATHNAFSPHASVEHGLMHIRFSLSHNLSGGQSSLYWQTDPWDSAETINEPLRSCCIRRAVMYCNYDNTLSRVSKWSSQPGNRIALTRYTAGESVSVIALNASALDTVSGVNAGGILSARIVGGTR
jgi:hypothetical protein